MSRVHGILTYGFNLGGNEDGWKVEGASEWGAWVPDWYDPDGGDSLIDAIEKRLLASVGFTETDWQVKGYFTRLKDAEEKLGLDLVTYCSSEYQMYILAACKITASQGDVNMINFAALEERRVEEGWDTKLRDALITLNITPNQAQPSWLLVSFWG